MPTLTLPPVLAGKVAALERELESCAPLLIAYSGGVDSACLLAFGHRVLGNGQMLGVIADSPSLPRAALAAALALAERLGAPVEVIRTAEMENPQYAANPLNRCYFCKSELFVNMERLASERRFAALAYGENADDPAHLRPGSQAAREYRVLAPLKSAGLTKAEVRELSRHLGLPTADAPAQPCLSSRILHGNPVTVEALGMVEAGEEWVRSLGFRIFRVRHSAGADGQPRARVQIAPEEMGTLPLLSNKVEAGLRAIGYLDVEFDPEGYRSST